MQLQIEAKQKLLGRSVAFGVKSVRKHLIGQNFFELMTPTGSTLHRISIREELSRMGSDWQYIFEMEHLQLHPTKPFLIEGRYLTVGHFEGKISSSWACEPGCYNSKLVLK